MARHGHQTITELSGNYLYIGRANSGALTSEAEWELSRYEFVDGVFVSKTWADGDEEFDNIWDNRASKVYS